LAPNEKSALDSVRGHPQTLRLEQVASVRIGVVTGANRWFVRTAFDAQALGAPHHAVIRRAAWLRTPVWRSVDRRAIADQPSELLVLPPDHEANDALAREIAAAEKNGLDRRHHCAARDVWWSLRDTRVPELFLPYMGASAPRLVLNAAGSTCTNAIHRVWQKRGSPSAAALVLGSWTSLWRLSAELQGRSYGGGVLKLEPGEAGGLHVPILLRDAARHLMTLEDCCREDGPVAARALADRLVLVEGLGLDGEIVELLGTAADRLEARRDS
jgi:hypothetical protein